jgi:hypothetical protein
LPPNSHLPLAPRAGPASIGLRFRGSTPTYRSRQGIARLVVAPLAQAYKDITMTQLTTTIAPTTSHYRGHAIQPLVYPQILAARKGMGAQRRYLASVSIVDLASSATRLSKLAHDFAHYGDARRAAEERGRHLIDSPEPQPDPFSTGSTEPAGPNPAGGTTIDTLFFSSAQPFSGGLAKPAME